MFPFLLRGARGNVGLTLGALRYFKDFDFMFVMGHSPAHLKLSPGRQPIAGAIARLDRNCDTET